MLREDHVLSGHATSFYDIHYQRDILQLHSEKSKLVFLSKLDKVSTGFTTIHEQERMTVTQEAETIMQIMTEVQTVSFRWKKVIFQKHMVVGEFAYNVKSQETVIQNSKIKIEIYNKDKAWYTLYGQNWYWETSNVEKKTINLMHNDVTNLHARKKFWS